MNINFKLTTDFERTMSALKEKYGTDFDFLNGFHDTQINFSDFIDGFVDKNVADVTIDANANASNKDIRSLLNEKGKSLDKLFAFNKIFYEMKKDGNGYDEEKYSVLLPSQISCGKEKISGVHTYARTDEIEIVDVKKKRKNLKRIYWIIKKKF